MGESSRYIARVKLDENGVAVEGTKAFLERFSLSSEQLKSAPLVSLLGSDELHRVLEAHHEKISKEVEGGHSEALLPIRNKRRSICWNVVEVITGPEKEDVLYFHDRTESYQAQMILESALMLESDLFVFFDTRGCVLQCSEEAVRIMGFPNRLEALGLHYTTFFHNRLREGLLQELFSSLEQGKGYEGDTLIRYKGTDKCYGVRAFNVMMKNHKAGVAICLKEIEKKDLYMTREDAPYVRGGYSPYVVRSKEEKEEPYRDMQEAEVLACLKDAIAKYEYTKCECMLEYLLRYGSKDRFDMLSRVKAYLDAFCYEQALSLFI